MRAAVRVVCVVTIAVTGCATVPSVADRRFAAGDYPGAAAAYEEALRIDPRAKRDAALCLRLAIAYAVPGTAAHDPRRALAALNEVAARFPRSNEAAEATLLVPQLEHEVALTAELAAARSRVEALEAELATARDEGRALESAAKAAADQVQRVRASLVDKEAQLRRVREELEQLKRIDLQRAP